MAADARLESTPDDEEASRERIAALDRLVEHTQEHGPPERALAAAEESALLRRAALARAPDDPERLRDLAAILRTVGDLHREHKAPARALPVYEEALRCSRRIVEIDPDAPEGPWQVSLSLNRFGLALDELDQCFSSAGMGHAPVW